MAKREACAVHVIPEGEHRRTSFHSDFISKLDGARSGGSTAPGSGGQFGPRAFEVTGKLRRTRPIELDGFRFLKNKTKRTPKQTIPSPTMLLRGGRDAVSREAYPDLAEFHA